MARTLAGRKTCWATTLNEEHETSLVQRLNSLQYERGPPLSHIKRGTRCDALNLHVKTTAGVAVTPK